MGGCRDSNAGLLFLVIHCREKLAHHKMDMLESDETRMLTVHVDSPLWPQADSRSRQTMSTKTQSHCGVTSRG